MEQFKQDCFHRFVGFGLAINKEAMVLDYTKLINGAIRWNPSFVRFDHD